MKVVKVICDVCNKEIKNNNYWNKTFFNERTCESIKADICFDCFDKEKGE